MLTYIHLTLTHVVYPDDIDTAFMVWYEPDHAFGVLSPFILETKQCYFGLGEIIKIAF